MQFLLAFSLISLRSIVRSVYSSQSQHPPCTANFLNAFIIFLIKTSPWSSFSHSLALLEFFRVYCHFLIQVFLRLISLFLLLLQPRPLSSLPALFLKLNRSCDLLSASRYLNVNTGLVYSRFPVSVSLRVLSSPFHLPFLLCLLRSFNDPKSIPTPQLLLLLTLQHRPNGECSPLARPFHADAFRSETGSVTCMSVT